jgi:hypothetical protein
MVAKIELTGNQMEGYAVTVSLPTAWLERWHPRACVGIFGEELTGKWGYKQDEGDLRYLTANFDTLAQAQAAVVEAQADLEAAIAFLRSLTETSETTVIAL